MIDFASCSISDSIATITLDDSKANAFSFDMMVALNNAMDEAEAGADVIIITGVMASCAPDLTTKYKTMPIKCRKWEWRQIIGAYF